MDEPARPQRVYERGHVALCDVLVEPVALGQRAGEIGGRPRLGKQLPERRPGGVQAQVAVADRVEQDGFAGDGFRDRPVNTADLLA